MSTVIAFPGAHTRAPVPPVSAVDELEAAELALLRARLAQIQAETRQLNAIWFTYCFRKFLFWGVLAWLLYALASPAAAESRSLYGPNGGFVGSSLVRGNQTTFYSASGRFIGSEIRHGKQRAVYGPAGNFVGSIVTRR